MSTDSVLSSAHAQNKTLSIRSSVQFREDGTQVIVFTEVLAERGEYSFWSARAIDEPGNTEKALREAQLESVQNALELALYTTGVTPPLHSPPKVSVPLVSAESASPANAIPCEGVGEAHNITDYWSGTAYLSAEEVAALNLDRHQKRLCVSCALGLIPTRGKGKNKGKPN